MIIQGNPISCVCDRCGHGPWKTRLGRIPLVCAGCKSRIWNIGIGVKDQRGKRNHTDAEKAHLSMIRKGSKNPNWKGDNVEKDIGRDRARRMYPVRFPCEVCGSGPTDRHHKDDNPLNNSPSNIAFLCRRHHMEADGRLRDLVSSGASRNKLTLEKAIEIRTMLSAGDRLPVIAARFGVTPSLISYVRAGKIWKESCEVSAVQVGN